MENSVARRNQPRGWKAVGFILGNETFERLATFSFLGNFTLYLIKVFNMEPVNAEILINVWSGFMSFTPLIGGFVSDSYAGRFRTILFASFASLLGMMTLTLTAWLPSLHPENCHKEKEPWRHCEKASTMQLGSLIFGLGLLSIGTGGIRPCNIPFGVDQFDQTTEEGSRGIKGFYNLYYGTFTAVMAITSTLMIYIQSISWVAGFGIPTLSMLCSIIAFLIGTKFYVRVTPRGSFLTNIAQVFVAAYRKRKLVLDRGDGDDVDDNVIFYDPPHENTLTKLHLTDQFRFLNKAAILENDDANVNNWRVCSIQQVEEVKSLLKILPIWSSGIIGFVPTQASFLVFKALRMDRHFGKHFQFPPASVNVISMITTGIWLPLYDKIVVPILRRFTKREEGITLLQKIGTGIVFAVLSQVVAGLVEMQRRNMAVSHPGSTPMSAMWLAPQLVLLGICDAFYFLGQLELLNREFPEHMKGMASAIVFCSQGGSYYVSSLIIKAVKRATRTPHGLSWIMNDLNQGKLDYFHYLLAVMGMLNFSYFLFCASKYRYKQVMVETEESHSQELQGD